MGSGSVVGTQIVLPPASFQLSPLPTLPSFLLPQTQAIILARMLSRIAATLDTSEGSFLWDACAPASIELALANQVARETLRRGFARTTFGPYLDLRADEHGLTRRGARLATVIVRFSGTVGTVVPAGTRVSTASINNTVAYQFATSAPATVGVTGSVDVIVTALTAGTGGNVAPNTINLMTDRVSGITSVNNAVAAAGGLNAESDPSLLNRLLYRVQQPSAGGNPSDYVTWALSVVGVGSVSVVPVRDGNGTVSLALLDTSMLPASQALIDAVQNYISPPFSVTYEAESTTPTDGMAISGSGVSLDATQTDASGGSAVKLVYSPHLITPAAPTLAAIANGTLVAGTYFYRVTATSGQGGETLPSTAASVVTAATGGIVVRWTAVNNATGYNVFGRPSSTGTEGLLGSIVNVVQTGSTTNASATVTALASTANLAIGMPVVGSGVPAATTIATIVSPTSITLSANATATATGVSLIFHTTRYIDSGTPAPGRLASAIAANTTGLAGPLPVLTWGVQGNLVGGPTTYSYRLTALTPQGETPAGSAATQVVSSGNNNAITLSWSPVTNATGYNVYGRTAGAEGKLITLGNVTTWTDQGTLTVGTPLASSVTDSTILSAPLGPTFSNAQSFGGHLNPSATYFYRISALNALGETLAGSESSYTPPPGFATAQVTVNWAAVAGATGYRVYRTPTSDAISGHELRLATLGNVLSYADTTLTIPSGAMPISNTTTTSPPGVPSFVVTAGTIGAGTFGYRVSALNAQGESTAGAIATVATTGTGNAITLAWAPVPGATGYSVFGRSSTAGSDLRMATWNGTTWSAGSGTANTWIDLGTVTPSGALPSDTSQLATPSAPTFGGSLTSQTVAYRITAMDNASNETLPGTESSGLAITGPNAVVGLTWAAVPGAVGYRVYGRTAAGELLMATWNGTAWNLGYGTATSWTDTGYVTPAGALPAADLTVSNGLLTHIVTPSTVPSPSKLPQAGLYTVRPTIKASALTGTMPVFQFGMWSTSAGNWCPTTVSGPYGQAYQTLTASQLSTLYGQVSQQFYNNGIDNLQTRMMRLAPLPLSAPAVPAVAAQNVGPSATLPSGTYTVQVTARTQGGSSLPSVASAGVAILLTQGILVTLPALPLGAVSRDIYLASYSGSASPPPNLGYVGNTTTTTFTATIPAVTAAAAVPTVDTTQPDATTTVWVDTVTYRSVFSILNANSRSPVGARVTVEAATPVPISIRVHITIKVGENLSLVQTAVRQSIINYLQTIAFSAVDNGVKYAQVGTAILNTPGVLDYDTTTFSINGMMTNVSVGVQQVATLGSITWL